MGIIPCKEEQTRMLKMTLNFKSCEVRVLESAFYKYVTDYLNCPVINIFLFAFATFSIFSCNSVVSIIGLEKHKRKS